LIWEEIVIGAFLESIMMIFFLREVDKIFEKIFEKKKQEK